MTKKTSVIYALLFVCVFTFALSFTLASKAQAEQNCCYGWCEPPYDNWPAFEGHIIDNVCVNDGIPPCNKWFMCPVQ